MIPNPNHNPPHFSKEIQTFFLFPNSKHLREQLFFETVEQQVLIVQDVGQG